MALENLTAVGAAPGDSRVSHGMGGDIKGWSRTIEVTAAANVLSDYVLGYVPSNARILGISRVSWDDLASTAAPLMSVGLYPVDGNMAAAVVGALTDSLDVAAAAGTASMIKDIANYGKKAWQLAGLASDPKGMFQVRASLVAAATNTGGTVTGELFFQVP